MKTALQERVDAHGIAAHTTGYGSLFNLHFLPADQATPAAVKAVDQRPGKLWHLEMMLADQYVTPRGLIALALPHTQVETDGLLDAFERFLADYRSILPKVK